MLSHPNLYTTHYLYYWLYPHFLHFTITSNNHNGQISFCKMHTTWSLIPKNYRRITKIYTHQNNALIKTTLDLKKKCLISHLTAKFSGRNLWSFKQDGIKSITEPLGMVTDLGLVFNLHWNQTFYTSPQFISLF